MIFFFKGHPTTVFKSKAISASQVNVQQTAVILGRRMMDSATFGARRSCSGGRLSRNAGALAAILPLLPLKMSMTTYS